MLELLSNFKGSSIELHYWFNDDSHKMDALVQNKCEAELLAIIKTVATELEASLLIETEPLGEGGLKRWFNIEHKRYARKKSVSTEMATAIVAALMASPLDAATVAVGKEGQGNMEEADKLLHEKILALELDQNTVVIKRRSNFYQQLAKYPKLSKVSFSICEGKHQQPSQEFVIEKASFHKYILKTNVLDPLEVDDAVIEIISPVLKTGNYKWRGLYEGSAIVLSMKSNEFKTLVQTGAIEFKNGTSIKCQLEIKRKINSQGIEVITEYNILGVNEYYNMDIPAIQTKEGKANKKKKPAPVIQQLDLFG